MIKFFKRKTTEFNRKKNSENQLSNLGIKYNPGLPITYENNDITLRSPKEIAAKTVSLWFLINLTNDPSSENKKDTLGLIKQFGLLDTVSTCDLEFLTNNNHSEQDIIDLTWRTETIKTLYWALNLIPNLGTPIEDESVYNISEDIVEKYPSPEVFISNAKLRSKEEILNETDFIYRLHWASRPHRRSDQNVPANYDYSVIRERDFALRWITNPNIDWDEITLDT